MNNPGLSSTEILRSAIVLLEHGCDREALACVQSIHAPANPTLAGDYFLALASCHRNLGDFPQALNAFNTGIGFDPGNFQLKYGRALLHLLNGRWKDGWSDYEIRRTMQAANGQGRLFNFPQLALDDDLSPIFVYGEQGLGDEVMFASTLMPVFGSRAVMLECAPQLVKLFKRSFPNTYVVERNLERDPRRYSYTDDAGHVRRYREIAAGSIPLYASRLNVNWFYSKPYLVPDPARVAFYRGQTSGFRVGVSWTGGTKLTRRAARSMDLRFFMERMRAIFPSAQFVSLQHDATETAPDLWQPFFNDAFGDLDATAALIASCDLVVSVCNTNVHLAGALGISCYCLAPYVPEWRYGLSNVMVWYSHCAQICRQDAPGTWAGAFAQLAKYRDV